MAKISKELERVTTYIGVVMLAITAFMLIAPMVMDVKKDYTDQWYVPTGIALLGLGLIGAKEAFFDALGKLFQKKSDTL